MAEIKPPLWLLAELTYRCPLQCPYCSNPTDFAAHGAELSTEDWLRVMSQARQLGAVQLGFSGGEPLVRQDLAELVREARKLGFYSNLISSGVGMNADKVAELKQAGLDHIQISFQASSRELNDLIAGSQKAFEQKIAMAKEVKRQGYPMVLNFVLHRDNIDQIEQILELSLMLQADYVELANSQYYGWAYENIEALLPSREQLQKAEAATNQFRQTRAGKMKIIFVVPDYYENRPKKCMNGWGSIFLTIAPDGTALPCHSARQLPIEFPNVKTSSVREIWYDSPGFNHFRGNDWMREPCRSCPEQQNDLGGCRCQAYMIAGDAAATDPICDKSPQHHKILETIERAQQATAKNTDYLYRNWKNSKNIIAKS